MHPGIHPAEEVLSMIMLSIVEGNPLFQVFAGRYKCPLHI
jgi:hypothetical protein